MQLMPEVFEILSFVTHLNLSLVSLLEIILPSRQFLLLHLKLLSMSLLLLPLSFLVSLELSQPGLIFRGHLVSHLLDFFVSLVELFVTVLSLHPRDLLSLTKQCILIDRWRRLRPICWRDRLLELFGLSLKQQSLLILQRSFLSVNDLLDLLLPQLLGRCHLP
jgi:hypothetical protein